MRSDSVATITADEICWALTEEPTTTIDDDDLIVEALVEAAAYRQLAQRAIHTLHDLTVDHARLRNRHHRLLEEYRALRVRTRRPEAPA